MAATQVIDGQCQDIPAVDDGFLPGQGKSKAARARHKLAKFQLQATTARKGSQLPEVPLRAGAPLLHAIGDAAAEQHAQSRALEPRAPGLAHGLWLTMSLLLVLLGARWGSEMGAMRQLEKLDAKVQHLQAQQEVAHCLPWQEEDVDDLPFKRHPQLLTRRPTESEKDHGVESSHDHGGTSSESLLLDATGSNSEPQHLEANKAADEWAVRSTMHTSMAHSERAQSAHDSELQWPRAAYTSLLQSSANDDHLTEPCLADESSTGQATSSGRVDAGGLNEMVPSIAADSSEHRPSHPNEQSVAAVEEVHAHVEWGGAMPASPEPFAGMLDVGLVWQAASVTMNGALLTAAPTSNASWRLQWNVSCTTALARRCTEDRTAVNLRHLVNSHSSEALWRLPWAQHENISSVMADPDTPCAQTDACVEVALSAYPWPEFEISHSGRDKSHLVHAAQSFFQPFADTPFAPHMVAASGAYLGVQSIAPHSAASAWQLSWANYSTSQTLVHHLLQKAERAAKDNPKALWRLPWAQKSPMDAGDLELDPQNGPSQTLRREEAQEMLQQRANWQLVWFHSMRM